MGLVASTCDIDKNELLYHDSPEYSECSDLDRLLELLKDKLKMSSPQEKVKILTLTPANWPILKTCNELHVSKYLVKKAENLDFPKEYLLNLERRKEMY